MGAHGSARVSVVGLLLLLLRGALLAAPDSASYVPTLRPLTLQPDTPFAFGCIGPQDPRAARELHTVVARDSQAERAGHVGMGLGQRPGRLERRQLGLSLHQAQDAGSEMMAVSAGAMT
eukprot:SAG11_NODE_4053_length_2085_cov_4.959718_2_plen_119_part_00